MPRGTHGGSLSSFKRFARWAGCGRGSYLGVAVRPYGVEGSFDPPYCIGRGVLTIRPKELLNLFHAVVEAGGDGVDAVSIDAELLPRVGTG